MPALRSSPFGPGRQGLPCDPQQMPPHDPAASAAVPLCSMQRKGRLPWSTCGVWRAPPLSSASSTSTPRQPSPTPPPPPPQPSTRLWSGTARAPPTDRSMRKGGASAASAPAAKSKKFALTLALYYLPGDDAVDPGATSIVRSIQGAVLAATSGMPSPWCVPPSPLPPSPGRDHAALRSRRPCFPRLVYVHPSSRSLSAPPGTTS